MVLTFQTMLSSTIKTKVWYHLLQNEQRSQLLVITIKLLLPPNKTVPCIVNLFARAGPYC